MASPIEDMILQQAVAVALTTHTPSAILRALAAEVRKTEYPRDVAKLLDRAAEKLEDEDC